MAYNEKIQIKLYSYENNAFVFKAIIDDYNSCSWERNLYQAGQFTITINLNIPNSTLFQTGLFIQFNNDPYDFGVITSISDSIGPDGKGSQNRMIVGYDCRYLFKRRIIKNLNNNDTWQMTSKGEICLRSLVYSEAGLGAEEKRRLPITNTIPVLADAIGKEYSVSESFTNLYDVLCTIATQSEIGWRVKFENNSLTLECYLGEDKSSTIQFSTDFDSLSKGTFTDTTESFSNAIYIGGKGDGSERDIYEGENEVSGSSPSGFDRFESWDNQSEMNTESEYEAEALSMLTQYGQKVTVSGNGLTKSPYQYKRDYDVGDIIKIAFSERSANAQVLSVVENWTDRGSYGITFSFGKPVNNLSDQLKLILNKIQIASSKSKTIDSVRWYELPSESSMTASEVTFNSIGFTGTLSQNTNFTLYLDNEGTGSKTYNIYVKNLSGNYKLILKTNVSGSETLALPSGTYVGQVYVDVNGNVLQRSLGTINGAVANNPQPISSGAVKEIVSGMNANAVGGAGKYIESISESNGVIYATEESLGNMVPVDSVTSGDMHSVTSNAVATRIQKFNLNAGDELTDANKTEIETSFDAANNYSLFQGATSGGYEWGWYGFKHTAEKGGIILLMSGRRGLYWGMGSGSPATWVYRLIHARD